MVKAIEIYKKICVLGDMKVGKTAIVNRYVKDEFTEEYTPSIGTKVSKKNVEIKDPSGQTQDMNVNLMVWDLLGSKEHASLHKVYYTGAEGGVVVCDATREDTLDNIDFWVDNFRSVVSDNAPIIIAINKIDAVESEVHEERIRRVRDLCKDLNVAHMEVSAKKDENIETLFYLISEKLVQVRPF